MTDSVPVTNEASTGDLSASKISKDNLAAARPTSKDVLLVCGCPRSGTTALAHLLNGHREVVIGYEVLATAFQDHFNSFGEGLFDGELFVDALCMAGPLWPEPNWTVAFPSRYKTRRLVKKSRIVGDKYPHYCYRLAELHEKLPRARFLAIYRDLASIAQSFERRYKDPNDPWPLSYHRAADYHYDALEKIVDAVQRGCPVTVVSYDAMFSGDEGYLAKVFDQLGLDVDDDLKRVYRALCAKAESLGQARSVEPQIAAYSEAQMRPELERLVNQVSVQVG